MIVNKDMYSLEKTIVEHPRSALYVERFYTHFEVLALESTSLGPVHVRGPFCEVKCVPDVRESRKT